MIPSSPYGQAHEAILTLLLVMMTTSQDSLPIYFLLAAPEPPITSKLHNFPIMKVIHGLLLRSAVIFSFTPLSQRQMSPSTEMSRGITLFQQAAVSGQVTQG